MVKMKKGFCVLLLAALMVTLFGGMPVLGDTAVNDFYDFENGLPSGVGGHHTYGAKTLPTGEQVLAITPYAAGDNASGANAVLPSEGIPVTVMVRARVMLTSDQGLQLHAFRFAGLDGESAKVTSGFVFKPEGSVTFNGAETNATWEKNTWYDIAAVYKANGQYTPKIDAYINGKKVCENLGGNMRVITNVEFRVGYTGDADRGKEVYVDDLRVTNDTAYIPQEFTVLSSSPEDGAVEVDTSAALQLTFSGAVGSAYLSPRYFTLDGGNAPAITDVTAADNTVTLQLGGALAERTQYTVKVNGLVGDGYGNRLFAEKSVTFTTAGQDAPSYLNDFWDFNGLTAFPTGVAQNGGYSYLQNGAVNHKMAEGTGGSTGGLSITPSQVIPATDGILISARMLFPDLQTGAEFFKTIGKDSAGDTQYTGGVIIKPGGEILYGDRNIGTWIQNRWNTLEFLLNTAQGTAAVFLNGEMLAKDLTSRQGVDMRTVQIIFNRGVTTERSDPQIDDIRVTTNPAYFPVETLGMKSVPENGAVKVDNKTNMVLTFDAAIDPLTLENAFVLTGGAAAPAVSAALDATGKVVTLTFGSALEYKTTYTLNISADLKSTDGLSLADTARTVSFTTGELIFNYYYDFENDFGDLTKWGYNNIETDPKNAANKVGMVKAGTGTDGFTRGFSTLKGKITVAMRFMVPAGSDVQNFALLNVRTDAGKNNGSFSLDKEGKLTYNTNGVAFEYDRWYDLALVVNTDTGKADAYIDDNLIAGNLGGNYGDIGSVRSTFTANTGDGIAYYDDFRVTNDPAYIPNPAFELVNSNPADGAENVPVDTAITLSFTKNIKQETAISDNFTLQTEIGGVQTVIPVKQVNIAGKNCTLVLDTLLYGSRAYTLTIGEGLKSTAEIAITGGKSIRFTTAEGERQVGEIQFSKNALETGLITASVEVLNDKASDAPVTVIIALCEGTEEAFNIAEVTTVEKLVGAGEHETISASVQVNSTDGYFVKAFVWDTFDAMQPLGKAKSLK